MNSPIQHPREDASNAVRAGAARYEPRALRTYTPSLAVLARMRAASFTGRWKAAASMTSPPAYWWRTSVTIPRRGCSALQRIWAGIPPPPSR